MKYFFKLLLFLIALSTSFQLNGQYNYRDGFIVTQEKDTLWGLIKDRGELGNSKACVFKLNKKTKAQKYYPREISAYGSLRDKYYRTGRVDFKGERRYVFINVLLEGDVNLYYYWKDRIKSYYIEKDEGVFKELLNVDLELQQRSDGGHMAYSNYTEIKIPIYRDTLLSVFQESESIQRQVKSVKYNQESLQDITRQYILETCEGSNCISYEKDVNMYRSRFGIYTGIQMQKISFLSFNISSTSEPYLVESDITSSIFATYPIGISYNFPLFVLSDRLSFQVELSTTGMNFEYEFPDSSLSVKTLKIQSRTLSIPLLLKYQFSRKKVSPSLALGKSTSFVLNSQVDVNQNTDDYVLHTIQKGGWFLEFGLDYKLGPKLSLFNSFRIQSYNNLVVHPWNKNPYYNTLWENGEYLMEYKTYMAALLIGIKF